MKGYKLVKSSNLSTCSKCVFFNGKGQKCDIWTPDGELPCVKNLSTLYYFTRNVSISKKISIL